MKSISEELQADGAQMITDEGNVIEGAGLLSLLSEIENNIFSALQNF